MYLSQPMDGSQMHLDDPILKSESKPRPLIYAAFDKDVVRI